MFCYFDPFTITQTVLAITPESSYTLCTGQTMNEVCDLIASYYATGIYRQVILKGQLAETAADQIRMYGRLNYNLNDIEIEVI